MTLSIVFITREVRATGLRLFRTVVVPLFRMGLTVEWGTVLQVMELWNRGWITPTDVVWSRSCVHLGPLCS